MPMVVIFQYYQLRFHTAIVRLGFVGVRACAPGSIGREAMTYYSGIVLAVPAANKQAYVEMARQAWPMVKRHGAIRMVETWGEDVPHGKQTDFWRATDAKDGEVPLFSWIEWPDRETADKAQAGMEAEMQDASTPEMPFDGKRMFWGGFAPVFDSEKG
jgi:uncharacterized protein YbaA (DUF1428 family)